MPKLFYTLPVSALFAASRVPTFIKNKTKRDKKKKKKKKKKKEKQAHR